MFDTSDKQDFWFIAAHEQDLKKWTLKWGAASNSNVLPTKVLIDWINDVLVGERIIVKDLAEDLYDGQVLQKLFGKQFDSHWDFVKACSACGALVLVHTQIKQLVCLSGKPSRQQWH